MKTLYLHRHAKSSWDHHGLSDFERPLNERGTLDAPEMGRRLSKRGERIDTIVSSPAERAITTARAVAKEIGFPKKYIVTAERLYLPSVSTILDVVNRLDDQYQSAMLFGHNPGFTAAIGYLSGHEIFNLSTAGVARIDFPFESWAMVTANSGILQFIDYPKKPFVH